MTTGNPFKSSPERLARGRRSSVNLFVSLEMAAKRFFNNNKGVIIRP